MASVPYWTSLMCNKFTMRITLKRVNPQERPVSAQVLEKSHRRLQVSELRRAERESEQATGTGQGERAKLVPAESDKAIFCNGLEGS